MSDSNSSLVAGSSYRLLYLSSYTTNTPDTSTNRTVRRFAEPKSLLDSLAFPRYFTRAVAVILNEIPLPWTDNHSAEYRHRDGLSRIEWHRQDDRYLSFTDGRLKRLVVQATDDVRLGPRNGTWARTGIRNVTPIQMRIVYWVLKRHIEGKEKAMSLEICLKWVPACLVTAVLLCIPADLGGEKRNNGLYEQFKYHFWGYSYIPSNPLEASKSSDPAITPADGINGIAERPLRPRYLCFPAENGSVDIVRVADWESQHGRDAVLEYIFISYTSAQFDGPDDSSYLHSVAAQAVRSASVPAYWISCSCMPNPDELSEDVHRISDIVRGSHSVAIILGRPINNRNNTHPIAIYTRAGDMANPTYLQKRNFPVVAWTDAPLSRQLVDHYEGSILLSPLELVTLALQCLSGRAHNTAPYFPGDLTYVLMGLLRRRPRVNGRHSAFQEFCRLSLANDSNRLLERLICLLPSRREQEGSWEWHDIHDTWSRNFWTLRLFASPVNLLLRNTIKRTVSRAVVRGIPAALLFGTSFLVTGRSQGGMLAGMTALGWLLTGPAIIAILLSPRILAALYIGKTWRAQPWLFGFEGMARSSKYGDEKVFTLIDTNLMTVTLFSAVRPPIALVLCGSEGGMQRGLLCSYDWKSQTLYRESVLRVDTMVLEKMSRVDRFKLGLRRPLGETEEGTPGEIYSDGRIDKRLACILLLVYFHILKHTCNMTLGFTLGLRLA
ncbi:hypothetical protein BDW60DRAFT_220458 [Aspergillus nidulans var. acristatus]